MLKIYQWFSNNSLMVNVEKTETLLFRSQKTSIPLWNNIAFKYLQKEKHIKISTHAKYLDVLVDSHLRWDHQMSWTCRKLRYLPYIFKKLKNIVSAKVLETSVYHALFYSSLRYVIIVWGSANKSNRKKIENIQKRILKVIYNKPLTYSTELLFIETNQLNI